LVEVHSSFLEDILHAFDAILTDLPRLAKFYA
jgi:hypothetical protein